MASLLHFILEDSNGSPLLGQSYKLDIPHDFEEEWFGNPSSEIDVTICSLQQLFEKFKTKKADFKFKQFLRLYFPLIRL